MIFEYVYLSFSHSEQQIADQLVKKMEAAGHKVWLVQNAGSDAQQQRQMAFAIERSEAFVLELDPEALEAAESNRELTLAQEAGKPIFLIQVKPGSLPADLGAGLNGHPLVDLSSDFDTGLEELLSLLSGSEPSAGESHASGNFFGGEHLGKVPVLPGEQIVWSEPGRYWFKKWRTLVRVLVTLTNQRLIFFWDSRDIWKWRPRESDELEEAFPIVLLLEQITAVGDVFRPKTFLIFATGTSYVEIETNDKQVRRFSLQQDFEENIDTLRAAVNG